MGQEEGRGSYSTHLVATSPLPLPSPLAVDWTVGVDEKGRSRRFGAGEECAPEAAPVEMDLCAFAMEKDVGLDKGILRDASRRCDGCTRGLIALRASLLGPAMTGMELVYVV